MPTLFKLLKIGSLAIIEDFAERFVDGHVLVYGGDTGKKWGYFDAVLLANLGVEIDTAASAFVCSDQSGLRGYKIRDRV